MTATAADNVVRKRTLVAGPYGLTNERASRAPDRLGMTLPRIHPTVTERFLFQPGTSDFDPPSPVITVALSFRGVHEDIEALFDTGTDLTQLRPAWAKKFDIREELLPTLPVKSASGKEASGHLAFVRARGQRGTLRSDRSLPPCLCAVFPPGQCENFGQVGSSRTWPCKQAVLDLRASGRPLNIRDRVLQRCATRPGASPY